MTRTVGFARPLPGSDLEADVVALRDAGAESVAMDRADRDHGESGLELCLRDLVAGDVLMVPSAAHVAGSVVDFVSVSVALGQRGVGLRSLAEPGLSSGVPGMPDASEALVALEDLRHRLISQRTRAGMADATARGRRMGRPTVMTPERIELALELRTQHRPIAHVARVLGVSASAVQRALRSAGTAEVIDSRTS